MNPLEIPSGFDIRNSAHLDDLMVIFSESVLEFFKVTVTWEQERIAREIIYRVLLRKRYTIDLSACRQIGKTEVVCYCAWFLSYLFPLIESETFRCIITAPEKGTGSEVFDRTKKLYDDCERDYHDEFKFKQKNLDVVILQDGTRLDVFGLFKGFSRREEKKTTKEGRSAHMIIRDEKHLGDDEIYKDEIEPAMSTTGGVDVWVGNGGFRQCRAKEMADLAENGKQVTYAKDMTIFRLDYTYMREAMLKEYERTKNPMFMRWIESQDKYIEDHGMESDEVQKNLFLKWLVTVGNFIAWESLIGHRRAEEARFASRIADVGIDFAKGENGDETVATIVDYERNVRDWEIFSGDWPDQVDEIALWLPEAAAKHNVSLQFIHCDSTGVGDPVKSYLRRKIRTPTRGIVFGVQSEDAMAKKMLKAFAAKSERERVTYPQNHKHTNKFEKQMKGLLKHRRATGQLKLTHGTGKHDHDDFAQSLALALWNIEKIRGSETTQKDDY